MPKQNETFLKKKTHRVHFVLANSLLHSMPWSVLDMPSDSPSEKTDFPFASRYQLQVAFWFGWFGCSLFPLSAEIPSDLGLCRSCVFSLSLCEYICASILLGLEDPVSLDSFITSNS